MWGHIYVLFVVRSLPRRWKVKTLLADPSPTSPMKAKINSNNAGGPTRQ